MSAIWGIINLDNKKLDNDTGIDMMDEFKKYKIDEFSFIQDNNFFLGCGKQYITKETIKEVIPYYDEVNNISITADAILDNRAELIEELKLDCYDEVSDSFLILKAYRMWGKECCNFLVGDFTFVIIDREEIFMARDHCGHRSLYYHIDENRLIFSTTLTPIKKILKDTIKLNEQWIASYLIDGFSIPNENIFDTVYNGIFLLPPASILNIKNRNKNIKKYWNPLEYSELKLNDDEEYFKRFRDVLKEAVDCRVRSAGEIGIMLSGGLDSSSVGAFAAMKLSKENKQLKAFTSIPFDGYKDIRSSRYVSDEREYIKPILNKYKNIDIKYCDGDNRDSIDVIEEVLDKIEQPYNAIENSQCLIEICNEAKKSLCKVVLTGQFGNLSVSYGDYFSNAKTLIDKKKYYTFLKEVYGISKIMGKSKLFVIKNTLNIINNKRNMNNIMDSNIILNKNLTEQYKDKLTYSNSIIGFEETKKIRIENLMKNSVGSIDTLLGLHSGLIFRDPTKDKRVIEFCISLPRECFVRNGKERFIIREAMKDIIPDEIAFNYTKRGAQGVDWIQRLEDKIETKKDILKKILYSDNLKKIMNKSEVEKIFNKINEKNLYEERLNLKKIIKFYMLEVFINNS